MRLQPPLWPLTRLVLRLGLAVRVRVRVRVRVIVRPKPKPKPNPKTKPELTALSEAAAAVVAALRASQSCGVAGYRLKRVRPAGAPARLAISHRSRNAPSLWHHPAPLVSAQGVQSFIIPMASPFAPRGKRFHR